MEAKELLPIDPNSATPHHDKLRELLSNQKLPENDKDNVQAALERYRSWIQNMDELSSEGDEKVRQLVELVDDYKRFIELELIWDSEADFLYRQRGQLKLDNSILEEFLPRLIDPAIMPELKDKAYARGPRRTFAAAYFTSSLSMPSIGAGLQIRSKNQDFTVSRAAYLQASHDRHFPPSDTVTHEIYLAFVAAECKTNLDKTMFQEAVATAHDLKIAVPGSRYYLLCEWLDMTPISTSSTDIDEVLILRGKRISSNVRAKFATRSTRELSRSWYEGFLRKNPIRLGSILRFTEHIRAMLDATELEEEGVLEKGYF